MSFYTLSFYFLTSNIISNMFNLNILNRLVTLERFTLRNHLNKYSNSVKLKAWERVFG